MPYVRAKICFAFIKTQTNETNWLRGNWSLIQPRIPTVDFVLFAPRSYSKSAQQIYECLQLSNYHTFFDFFFAAAATPLLAIASITNTFAFRAAVGEQLKAEF